MRITFDGELSVPKQEDSGLAAICEFAPGVVERNSDGNLFVRLQSRDEQKQHLALTTIAGRRVRVTIEVLT
jgi:hypothetical protein